MRRGLIRAGTGEGMQLTLIKVAATLAALAIIAVVVGFAVLPRDSPSLRMVRGIAIALLVLAFLAGISVGLLELWS
jgi:hypothetical protein